MTEPAVIRDYFAAMRQGAAAGDDLFSLFTPDATYIEPFTGLDPAEGIDAIRRRFELMWQTPLPDLELDVRSVTVHGNEATSSWVCRSPALPGPQAGEDHYVLRDGRITRLEIRLVAGSDNGDGRVDADANADDGPGDHSA
ncbi:MAG: nuclear transport factor 2 family protein [Actinomycetota bacterium]